jgi:hypothetical protein
MLDSKESGPRVDILGFFDRASGAVRRFVMDIGEWLAARAAFRKVNGLYWAELRKKCMHIALLPIRGNAGDPDGRGERVLVVGHSGTFWN